MFRLTTACLLSGGLLWCGSAVRNTAWRDFAAALQTRPCGGCGAELVWDPATNRSSACGDCATFGPVRPASAPPASRPPTAATVAAR